jgi:hypothetical protein
MASSRAESGYARQREALSGGCPQVSRFSRPGIVMDLVSRSRFHTAKPWAPGGKATHIFNEANRRVSPEESLYLVHARRWKVPLAFGKARLTDRRAGR